MTPPAPTAAVITGGAKAKLAADVFALPRNDALVHQVVTAELAARRQGTHSTKTRGLVAGGRAKPWRQKGTGRARQGTIRAPQWTGGGVAFGPHPRNYTGKINKKARGKALSIALSAHATDGTLVVADAATFEEPKTKQAAELVAGHGLRTPLVVVTAEGEDALERSFRNLHRTHVVPVGTLEVAEVVWARSLVVTKAALAVLEGELGVRDDPRAVLIAPVVSEKSYGMIGERGKYTFRVHPDAHKTQIRQAVERVFEVDVIAVNVSKVPAKPKRRGMTRGSRPGWKKAVVTVAPGQTIEAFGPGV